LGRLYFDLGRYETSLEHYKEALTCQMACTGENHEQVKKIYEGLRDCYEKWDKKSDFETCKAKVEKLAACLEKKK